MLADRMTASASHRVGSSRVTQNRKDELRPHHIHSGRGDPVGQRETPAGRITHDNRNDDAEQHGNGYPDRDHIADQLHQGRHDPT